MKVLTFLFLILTPIIYYSPASAQQFNIQATELRMKIPSGNASKVQNVFFELGGQGLQYSVNYDTRFSDRRNGFGGRIGLGYLSLKGKEATTIPVSLNYLLGKGRHFADFGLGATLLLSNGAKPDIFEFHSPTRSIVYTTNISYRFQPIQKGLFFRAGVGPVFNYDFILVFYLGLSLGYTF
jgi:hypothetical protein